MTHANFDRVDLVPVEDNPEPRCPAILLLDRSWSMDGAPINALNQGLAQFVEELNKDSLARLRVEPVVVSFGGDVTVYDPDGVALNPDTADPAEIFTTVDQWRPPHLTTNGGTPMGQAVLTALELLHARKAMYRQHGLDYFRPWLVIISDGYPNLGWEQAARKAQEDESAGRVIVLPIAVQGADLSTLSEFSSAREAVLLDGLKFGPLFEWLSNSLTAVSNSNLGEQVAFQPPQGWAVIDTSPGEER